MKDWFVFVDVSGSLLADAKAEIVGECLRCFLQDKSINPEHVYLWGDEVQPWSSATLHDPVAWRGLFSGMGRLESLVASIREKDCYALVISDGYVFHDASSEEKLRFKEVKADTALLLLEQDRRLNLKGCLDEKKIFSPSELMILSDRLKVDGQGI